MIVKIDDRFLEADVIAIVCRTFYNENKCLHNKIRLLWDEDLHNKILADSQLNYSIARIMKVFSLYARVISTRVPETSVHYVELRIVKKKGPFKKNCIFFIDKIQISRLIEGMAKIIDSFDHSDLQNFIITYFKGYYTDFIHFIIIQFLLTQESFRNQHFTSR